MSEQAAIGGRALVPVDQTKGDQIWRCACGRSKSQPFCDRSREITDASPLRSSARIKCVFFCRCKHPKTMPHRDGMHNKLSASAN